MTPSSRSSGLPDGLLVSVRSAFEADEAVAGGASIVDVKEPSRGPLGRADVEVAVEVGRAIAGRAGLTLACGELAADTGIATSVALIVERLAHDCHPGPLAAKAGPAGLTLDRWRRAHERLRDQVSRTAGAVEVVAVAYADWPAAAAPEPMRLIEAAIAGGAATILIDTFDKAAGGLFDAAGIGPVGDWVAAAQAAGLRVALAGRLTADAIGLAAGLGADVVGVRSAACGGDRVGRVGRGHVARIVGTLAAAPRTKATPPRTEAPEKVTP